MSPNDASGVRPPDPLDLLTTKQVSAWTGAPAGTLGYWRCVGEGPTYIKIGNNVRYRRADVDAWLEAQIVHIEPKGAARIVRVALERNWLTLADLLPNRVAESDDDA